MTARAPPVTPEDRLYRIVEDGMCIGCGLCESVAGPGVVRVEKVESGYECPVVVGDLDHETVDRILDVCPGTRLDGLPDRLVDADTKHDLTRLRQLGPLGDDNALIFRARTPKGRHYTARPGGPRRGVKTEAWARAAWAISGAVDAGAIRAPGSAGYGEAAPDGARRRSAHECRPSATWRTCRGWHVG